MTPQFATRQAAFQAEMEDGALALRRHVTVASIQAEVATFFGTPVLEMVSHRRHRGVARPRQIAMFLASRMTTHTLSRIGMFFGGRDHSTVIHAINLVEALMERDANLARNIAHLQARLA